MFLAHFGGTSLDVLLKWNIRKLYMWHQRAVKLYNKMNSTDKNEE